MQKAERKRIRTRQVKAGTLLIGGGAPVSLQSMINRPTTDPEACIAQINQLKKNGAGLVRLAVRDEGSLESLDRIIRATDIPLCADIHFNYRLAIACIEMGISKVRINPGNIGSLDRVKEVVKAASERGVPIRIGVNSGSINRKRFSHPTPEALVESAMEHVVILEDCGFHDIVISIKSSDPVHTIQANLMMSRLRDYPIHVGLTEAGYGLRSAIQSSVVIGHLLMKGIGDTIRVSMTGDPVDELKAGKLILETTGDLKPVLRVISCPTCGRTGSPDEILEIAMKIEEAGEELASISSAKGVSLTAAVMGCEVNGPGEAAEADCGLAGTADGRFLLFAGGKKINIVEKEDAVAALIGHLREMASHGS